MLRMGIDGDRLRLKAAHIVGELSVVTLT